MRILPSGWIVTACTVSSAPPFEKKDLSTEPGGSWAKVTPERSNPYSSTAQKEQRNCMRDNAMKMANSQRQREKPSQSEQCGFENQRGRIKKPATHVTGAS